MSLCVELWGFPVYDRCWAIFMNFHINLWFVLPQVPFNWTSSNICQNILFFNPLLVAAKKSLTPCFCYPNSIFSGSMILNAQRTDKCLKRFVMNMLNNETNGQYTWQLEVEMHMICGIWHYAHYTFYSILSTWLLTSGSCRQGVGTVHASSNFAASHHYES